MKTHLQPIIGSIEVVHVKPDGHDSNDAFSRVVLELLSQPGRGINAEADLKTPYGKIMKHADLLDMVVECEFLDKEKPPRIRRSYDASCGTPKSDAVNHLLSFVQAATRCDTGLQVEPVSLYHRVEGSRSKPYRTAATRIRSSLNDLATGPSGLSKRATTEAYLRDYFLHQLQQDHIANRIGVNYRAYKNDGALTLEQLDHFKTRGETDKKADALAQKVDSVLSLEHISLKPRRSFAQGRG